MATFSREYLVQNARFVVLVLLLLMVAAAFYFFHAVLLPFALAIFLAYLLSPVIDWIAGLRLRRWPVPRGVAILAVYAVLLGVIVLSGFYLAPRFYVEVNRMVRTFPETLHTLESDLVQPLETVLNDWVVELFPPVENGDLLGEALEIDAPRQTPGTVSPQSNAELKEARPPWQTLVEDYTYVVRRLDDTRYEIVPRKRRPVETGNDQQTFQFNRQITSMFAQLRQGVEENLVEFVVVGRSVVRALLTSFFALFLVLMISGFLLVDPERIHTFARSLVPPRFQMAFDDWLARMDHGLSGVVRGQALICLINGVLTGIGIAILGVPFVVTLSVIAALFSLIPIFGVLISTVPILVMAFTVSPLTALLALAWILIIHFIEGNFLNPKILGDSAKIHPVLIVFALLVGEHFAGVVGALLAVPIFSLVQNSFLFLKHQAETLDSAT